MRPNLYSVQSLLISRTAGTRHPASASRLDTASRMGIILVLHLRCCPDLGKHRTWRPYLLSRRGIIFRLITVTPIARPVSISMPCAHCDKPALGAHRLNVQKSSV